MKVVIVGGGISGIFAAVLIKQVHPSYQVAVIEHKDKILKKLALTGNGKCNFANANLSSAYYSNELFVDNILNKNNYRQIVGFLSDIHVKSHVINNLYYPISNSSLTVINALLKQIDILGIEVITSTELIDYDARKKIIKTNNGEYGYDKLIIATGGSAYPTLGSDGSIYDILDKHHYDIVPLKPSLCPIKVKENVHAIEGLRRNANVELYVDNKLIHKESGEVLFKKDGLSGIVIFNMSHHINMHSSEDVKLILDILTEESKDINSDEYEAYFHPAIASYLKRNNLNPHKLVFTYKSHYGFEHAQVSDGGLSIKCINNDLSSKIEKDIFFIGEVLDISGVCGGYNIMWAFASAKKVSEII